jgi:two-component system OmpR family sensor kinase
LRARLLWAFLVPLTVVLVLVAAVATLALRHELVSQVDSQLEPAVTRSTGYGPGWDGDGDHGAPPPGLGVRGQSAGTLNALVIDGTTQLAGYLRDDGTYGQITVGEGDVLAAVPLDSATHTVDLGSRLGSYRVVAVEQPDGDKLVIGLPLSRVYAALGNLLVVEVLAGLAGLLAAAIAGVLVIRRTLRPLTRVADTATRVSELPLSVGEVALHERVPAEDADTHTEVGRVGTALNRLLDHVETALAARQASETQVRQFVADASHELRTPLASIRGYTELVRRQARDGRTDPDDVAHALRRVESEAVRMSGLVDDLLLLARLDAGRDLELDDVDLTALVVDAVGDAHVAGPRHGWRIDVPPAAVLVHGDGARLHQVLANLLANVRTHTPEGTTATVRLRAADGAAVLQVEDDGPGIPPALVSHVFERFARGDASRNRAQGSTGLGLAIVDAVVTAHGGSVTVTSEPGRTVFTVRIPGARVEHDAETYADTFTDAFTDAHTGADAQHAEVELLQDARSARGH